MESFPPNKNSCQFESHNEANESNILEKKWDACSVKGV